MSYYLPLMINKRRLHVCHLEPRHDDESVVSPKSNFWGFIVHTEKSKALFSIENKDVSPKLISRDGHHVDLGRNWTFVVNQTSEAIDGYDVYRVSLVKETASARHDDQTLSPLKVTGRMLDDTKPLTVSAVINQMDVTRPVFIVIEYHENGTVYEDAFKMYFCTNDSSMASSVALDFGSEASQARFAKTDANFPLVRNFEQILGIDKKEYWQGKTSDELFKSVFWINHCPRQVTNYGDVPMKVADSPFVSPLISATESADVYKNLELLPNLKLVELAQDSGNITYRNDNIVFPEGSQVSYTLANLSDYVMRESVLRILLGNFLHAILSQVNMCTTDKYVRLVVMAPNVYYQNKVFDMMKGLYQDFEIFRERDLYPKCKGLEVQVVSESDAAFIGARIWKRDVMKNAQGGYFLNIDSGKGTTDFSILKQQRNFSKFSSLYRDGMPAAGNVITYAFYEALYDFMLRHDIDIHPFFNDASKAALIDFMSYLEELKKNDVPESTLQEFVAPRKADVKDLTGLVRYMSNNKGRAIPNFMVYVDKKVDELVLSLKESIGHYMSINPCMFTQIVLSGRALLYHRYKDKLISMLKENNWVESEDNVVWVEGNQAKICCLKGALAIEGECDVNLNSGLIGSPLLSKTENGKTPNWIKKINSVIDSFNRRQYTGLDANFFYNGSATITSTNVTLRLGGRYYELNSDDRMQKKIYFLGNTFAYQMGDGPLEFIESNNLNFNSSVKELVHQSLFPYYKGSAGKPLNTFFNEDAAKNINVNSTKVYIEPKTTGDTYKQGTETSEQEWPGGSGNDADA